MLNRRIVSQDPPMPVDIDGDLLAKNLRTARRGAAGGPSGATAEHLKLLLESQVCTDLFVEAATKLARGRVPPEIVSAIRSGRSTALQKPDGGIRGIVVGDVFRRLVARTLAQQFGPQVECATHPFQYALSTRMMKPRFSLWMVSEHTTPSPGTQCSRVCQTWSMGTSSFLSSAFYDSPSTFLWEDELGEARKVVQGEGGEQGDPLMPLLFSLGQHRALVVVQAQLKEEVVCFPR